MQKLAISILNQIKPFKLINQLIEIKIEHVHYDVMDQAFVQNTAFSIKTIKTIVKKTNKHLVDIHLMVINPEKYIKKLQKVADYFSIHFESITRERIEKILQKYPNLKIGIAIKPNTSWKKLIPFLTKISHVLIMSVEPGKGGQSFIPNALKKMNELKSYLEKNKLKTLIEVDGGINDQTGPQAIKSGADSLVSGSFLIKNMSKKQIKKIITGKKQN